MERGIERAASGGGPAEASSHGWTLYASLREYRTGLKYLQTAVVLLPQYIVVLA